MTRPALILFGFAIAVVIFAGCRRDGPDDTTPTPGRVGTPYQLIIPSNLPPMDVPVDNPMTVEGIALGRFLFYEKRLSGDNGMSCGTCHEPGIAFTDGKSVPKGIDSIAGPRSTMPLINLGYNNFFFWDGRSSTLEDQILHPVQNPIEMHESWPNAVSKLRADAAYPTLFARAFGTDHIDSVLTAKAIAQFIRTMISGNSPFDKFRRGEATLPVDAQVGFDLFKKEGGAIGQIIPVAGSTPVIGQGGADCFHCHTEAAGLFTDEQFHNNGLDTVFTDIGRSGVTNNPADMTKFNTPTLRNIMVTAPYMHDGRFASLDQVLDHYNEHIQESSTLSTFLQGVSNEPGGTSLALTLGEKTDILAFLNLLTDSTFITNPAFSDPNQPLKNP